MAEYYQIEGFLCPKCGSDTGIIAEIHVIEYREIDRILVYPQGNAAVDLGCSNLGDGLEYEVESFHCWDCNHLIAFNEDDLLEYLEENKLLVEE